jgi:hypothetical protein
MSRLSSCIPGARLRHACLLAVLALAGCAHTGPLPRIGLPDVHAPVQALEAVETLDIDGLLDEHSRELGCLAAGYLALVLERTGRPRRSRRSAPQPAPHGRR